MTNEAIIKENIPNGIVNVKAIGGGNGKPQYQAEINAISICMDAARKDEAERYKQLLERASNIIGDPGCNISGSSDLACEQWQKDYQLFKSQQ